VKGMKRSHYRTKHRTLILRTIKIHQPISVTGIHSRLSESFETGRLKRLPAMRQLFKTVSDLLQCRLIVADKLGRGRRYNVGNYGVREVIHTARRR
jgi:hypothetical protein